MQNKIMYMQYSASQAVLDFSTIRKAIKDMEKTSFAKNTFISSFLLILGLIIFCPIASAVPVSAFDSSWTQFEQDQGVLNKHGYVDPGWGGQAFNAEYFFYKLNGNKLSIGLQTGFNLENGRYGNYYAGDLAISFDDNPSTYEYAIDFGLYTKDYDLQTVGNDTVSDGIDIAGVYNNVTWNNDIYFATQSMPFAMESGTLIDGALSENYWGKEGDSYYRIVTFDTLAISEIDPGNEFIVDTHWTMSCGNDAIDGNFSETAPPVPEPGTILILCSGFLGFALNCKKNI